ncbi:VOC family protein [Citrobacter sp. RHB25-C09]|uniref:VOC family protein n=1 Tax=Citrobacter TaxID=544 RepID=UPI0015EF512B|nr:VOC family protein [Citrobacter sp. RHB25-C09]QMI03440.1 VOC family protein [Citrobacter sp. RHB25-C09]
MKQQLPGVDVLFVAGFGPITRDAEASISFYQQTLGLPIKEMEGNKDYFYTELDTLGGVKHFALWPLSQAAESCFGREAWPPEVPVPSAWVEFEVQDIEAATKALVDQGYTLLIANRMEPWGQAVTRLLSPEGILTGVTITPWLRS